MAYTVPTLIPATLRAGDTASWRRSTPDYPASDGWALSYALVTSGELIKIDATADGANHLIDVSATTTGTWAPGIYGWIERVSKSGKIYTIDSGTVEILPSFFSATTGLDARTHAQKTLSALEAWIENHDTAVAEYEIAGRRMKYIPISDLLLLRSQYQREVNRQSGKSGRVYMRF